MAGIPFSEVGVEWFEAIVRLVTTWFLDPLEQGLKDLSLLVFNTPLPESGPGIDRVFGVPPASDEPWHTIHEATVAGEVMVFALIILLLCVQGRQVVRIFNVGTAYQHRRTERSAWTGAVLIVGWYWLGVLTLYFVQGVTVGLLPNVDQLGTALLEVLPTALGNPMVTLGLSVVGGIAMLLLEALFFLRQVLLYGYLYLMPIGLALAFGNLPVVSSIARRLCRQFVPLAILPIPAALLFRTYELLFASDVLQIPSSFLAFVMVVSLPVLALYVTWKTFRYASPLTARVLGGSARTALTVGAVATAGSIAGPRIASTVAKRGPKAAATEAVAQRAFSEDDSDHQSRRPTGTGRGGGTRHTSASGRPAESNEASTDSDHDGGTSQSASPDSQQGQAQPQPPAPAIAGIEGGGEKTSAIGAGAANAKPLPGQTSSESTHRQARDRGAELVGQSDSPPAAATKESTTRTQVRRTENDPTNAARIQSSSAEDDDIPYIESTVHRDSRAAGDESEADSRTETESPGESHGTSRDPQSESSTTSTETTSETDDD